jgi:hypothetical protein
MLNPWFRYRYPLKHLKKWLGWPWVIYLPLRGADAVCFTCDQERLLARQSFWLYHCHKVVVNYGTKSIPDPGGDFARPFPEAHPPLPGRQRFLFLAGITPSCAAGWPKIPPPPPQWPPRPAAASSSATRSPTPLSRSPAPFMAPAFNGSWRKQKAIR